ncbi:hypothetical protein D3C75_939380 [compost metagenome]
MAFSFGGSPKNTRYLLRSISSLLGDCFTTIGGRHHEKVGCFGGCCAALRHLCVGHYVCFLKGSRCRYAGDDPFGGPFFAGGRNIVDGLRMHEEQGTDDLGSLAPRSRHGGFAVSRFYVPVCRHKVHHGFQHRFYYRVMCSASTCARCSVLPDEAAGCCCSGGWYCFGRVGRHVPALQ